MNPRIEACRACPIQCMLENTAVSIKAKIDSSTPSKISSMTQVARLGGCPSSEISRIKNEVRTTVGKTDPQIGRTIYVLNIGITPPREGGNYYDPMFAIPPKRRLPKRG